jgi:holo-[acyl-carrier protein] synthase
MLYGVGTDIVAVARMRESLVRHGERFAQRLLAASEMDAYLRAKDGARFLAKRFAAKEAFSKALGTGLRPPATLQAIAVGHDALGKPLYEYDEVLGLHLAGLGVQAHLSISDEVDYVVAFAILEKTP